MRPIEILRFIRASCPTYWNSCFPHQLQGIRDALGSDEIDPSQVSKLLSPQYKPSAALLKRLDAVAVQERFAAKLRIPGLFEIASVEELRAKLAALELTSPAAQVFYPELGPVGVDEFNLGANERTALEILADLICASKVPLLSWSASYMMGARFLVSHCLPRQARLSAAYNSIVVIRPSSAKEPFAAELDAVSAKLNLRPSIRHGSDLFAALTAAKCLLILCETEVFRDRSIWDAAATARGLISQAQKRQGWTTAANVLVVGAGGYLGKLLESDDRFDVSEKVNRALAIEKKDRFPFFRTQWERFCRERKVDPDAEIGSRLTRSQWHYDRKLDQVWPINIRLRAFFASNLQNYAFVDPTQGFASLAGTSALPADVQFFHEDLTSHLGRLQWDGRGSKRAAVRFSSTALHWLTHDTLGELCRRAAYPLPATSARDAKSLDKRFSELAPLVQRIVEVHGERSHIRYVAGLGVKAILQDQWLRDDPGDRALAHWRLAERWWSQKEREGIAPGRVPIHSTLGPFPDLLFIRMHPASNSSLRRRPTGYRRWRCNWQQR